jgi:hypothetical protein
MKRQVQQLIFTIDSPRATLDNLTLHRVLFTPEFTRLDFSYIATDYYICGGWIHIAPESYLLNRTTGKRYRLIQAENIPMAPHHHYFESSKDWAFFSLYFKPLPMENCTIDYVEAEQPEATDFNIYGIELNMHEGLGVYSF